LLGLHEAQLTLAEFRTSTELGFAQSDLKQQIPAVWWVIDFEALP